MTPLGWLDRKTSTQTKQTLWTVCYNVFNPNIRKEWPIAPDRTFFSAKSIDIIFSFIHKKRMLWVLQKWKPQSFRLTTILISQDLGSTEVACTFHCFDKRHHLNKCQHQDIVHLSALKKKIKFNYCWRNLFLLSVSLAFYMSAQECWHFSSWRKHNLWRLFEAPQWGGSVEYPQHVFVEK